MCVRCKVDRDREINLSERLVVVHLGSVADACYRDASSVRGGSCSRVPDPPVSGFSEPPQSPVLSAELLPVLNHRMKMGIGDNPAQR